MKNRTGNPSRLKTVALGAIPVVVLAGVVSTDHIPGTDISLAVPYAAEGPGPSFNTLSEVNGTEVIAIDAGDDIEVDDNPAGHLNMTTVSVRTDMTLVQALARWVGTDDSLVPIEKIYPPGTDREEFQEQNQIAFSASEAAATVAAMNYLDIPTYVEVADVLDDSAAQGKLEPGEKIIEVNGEAIEKPGQVQQIVRALSPGDDIEVKVERDGDQETETIELGENPQAEGEPMIGIAMSSQPDAELSVEYNLQDVGGPSAGLIFTLAVIDKLTEGDLTGGNFVAGTGTISEDGTVGPIGGISHKVAKASDIGAELFLAPADNCAEATSRDHGEMVIAEIDTLEDAVEAIDNFVAGEPVAQCEN